MRSFRRKPESSLFNPAARGTGHPAFAGVTGREQESLFLAIAINTYGETTQTNQKPEAAVQRHFID